MTTDSVRKPTRQARSCQDASQGNAVAATQIPVLIRLPNLTGPPASEQRGHAAQLAASVAMSGSTREPGLVKDHSHPGASESADGTVGDTKAGAHAPDHPTRSAVRWWSDFRLPSSVVHAVVALSLIAVFVIAYLAIVGGGANQKELADGRANDRAETATGPKDVVRRPPHRQDTSKKAGAADAIDGTKVEQASSANKPDVLQNVKPPAAEVPEKQQEASKGGVPNTKSPEQQAAGDAEGEDAVDAPANDPEAIGQAGFAANAAPADPDQNELESTGRSNQASNDSAIPGTVQEEPTARSENVWPAGFKNEQNPKSARGTDAVTGSSSQEMRAGEPTSEDRDGLTTHAAYPTTNPASFQYPVDYHEFLNGPPAPEPNQYAPWGDGANRYDQQPATARLQPRINPPPVR